MPNVTVSVPDELHEKMKEHPEINWSQICRKAIEAFLANDTRVSWGFKIVIESEEKKE